MLLKSSVEKPLELLPMNMGNAIRAWRSNISGTLVCARTSVLNSIATSSNWAAVLNFVGFLRAIDDHGFASAFRQQPVEERAREIERVARRPNVRVHRPEKGDYLDVRVDGADGPHDLGTAFEYLVVVCLDRPGVEVVDAFGVPQVRGIVGLVRPAASTATHRAAASAAANRA